LEAETIATAACDDVNAAAAAAGLFIVKYHNSTELSSHQLDERLFLWCPAGASNIVFTCLMLRMANELMLMMLRRGVCVCV